MTAWELEPASNQTSSMSISLRKSVWPQTQAVPAGRISSGVRMNQASADSRMKRATMDLLISGERRGSPHLLQRKTAMGTPHIFWREMHQSGRVRTMLVMRSCPQAGSHVTVLIWSMARWRKVVLVPSGAVISVSILMNHCSVARVMTGLWQRQQWG